VESINLRKHRGGMGRRRTFFAYFKFLHIKKVKKFNEKKLNIEKFEVEGHF